MFLQRAPNHLSSRQRSWFLLLFLFHDSVSQAALSPGVPGLRHPQPCFSRAQFSPPQWQGANPALCGVAGREDDPAIGR